jgi:hypothetical protein
VAYSLSGGATTRRRKVRTDIRGKIKNFGVPKDNPLLAVYEAIANSFHSIYEARKQSRAAGIIDVRILRETSREGEGLPYINGFSVSDDGIGFDDDNYASFCTAESTRKESIGGKGVGRFAWLVVFRHAYVDSVYRVEAGSFRRTFEFDANLDDELPGDPAADVEPFTVVKMVGIKNEYYHGLPKDVGEIAQAIVEHCAPMLSREDAPELTLSDGTAVLNLREYFEEYRSKWAYTEDIEVCGTQLSATVLRAKKGQHRISFAAHGRLVTSRYLSKLLPGIPPVLGDDGFVVTCYVQGDILDEHVNANRSGFDLPTSTQVQGLMALPTLDDIAEKAVDVVRRACASELEEVACRKRAQVIHFITERRLEYRPILSRIDEVLNDVPLNAPDSKLDSVLSGFMATLRVDRRTRTDRALKTLERENTTADQIKELVAQVLEDVGDEERDNLAQHVATRKVVLSLFERRLGLTNEGKLEKEDALHGLIFPMKTTSNAIDPDRNHLWMIDERLSYHTYLASDVAMSSTEFLENGSPKRPDLNIFNIAWTFSEDVRNPHTSITVVEFKRPQRNEYAEDENPIYQVVRQVQDLRAGKVLNPATGVMITVKRDAPAYAYIVCDLTTRLREWASFVGLIETPDQEGFFGFNASANAYIEIISFTKLLNDARKRNSALFEKLKVDT